MPTSRLQSRKGTSRFITLIEPLAPNPDYSILGHFCRILYVDDISFCGLGSFLGAIEQLDTTRCPLLKPIPITLIDIFRRPGFRWSGNVTFLGNDCLKLRLPQMAVAMSEKQKKGDLIVEFAGVRTLGLEKMEERDKRHL